MTIEIIQEQEVRTEDTGSLFLLYYLLLNNSATVDTNYSATNLWRSTSWSWKRSPRQRWHRGKAGHPVEQWGWRRLM